MVVYMVNVHQMACKIRTKLMYNFRRGMCMIRSVNEVTESAALGRRTPLANFVEK